MMPPVKEISFRITQVFKCSQCNREWSSSVKIPPTGRHCPDHSTVEMLLAKSLYASGVSAIGSL